MRRPCRPLALAAVLNVTVGVAVAMAQTVMVRNAPSGTTVELVLNAATIGSATAGPSGDATLAVNLSANLGKTEIDAYIYVDLCDQLRRVLLVERGVQPPVQGGNCSRREIVGLFLVQRINTLVVDVEGPNPTVLMRRGPVRLTPPRVWAPAPTGLTLFGGGGFAMFRDAVTLACGNVTECGGEDFRGALTAGVVYWFTRNLAAEASYVKPVEVTAQGSGENFRFNSFLDAEMVTVAGKVGVPFGPVRLYGQVGTNYHRATFGTTQTDEDVTETIGDVTRTIPGGTQTFDLRTAGWGWQLGGGIEIWVTRAFALYGEWGRAVLKGDALDDADGSFDERLSLFLFGARVRIGR